MDTKNYKKIFDSLQVGYFCQKVVYDNNDCPVDLILYEFNERFQNITGHNYCIKGKSSKQIFGEALYRNWLSSLNTDLPYITKWSSVETDQCYQINVIPLNSDHILCIIREAEDLTLKDELQYLKEEAELASKASNGGLWSWDLNRNRLYLSPRWKEIIGYEDFEIPNIFESFRSRLHPEDLERVMGYIESYFQSSTEVIYDITFRLRHRNGSYRCIRSRGAAIRDSNGVPFRVAGSHADITTEIEYAKKEEESKKQLLHAAKLASIGELAASIAHEINTPLSVLLGTVDLLNNNISTKCLHKVGPLIQTIDESCSKIEMIASGLRTYSRQDSPELSAIDINTLIEQTIIFLESIYKKEHIKIIKKLNARPAIVKGNAGRLQQVLINLLTNARQAIKIRQEGEIIIETKIKAKMIEILVSDNGEGISSEYISKIFSPFFTTRLDNEGTGLGLSISKKILAEINGHIEVAPNSGHLTTFTIKLPLVTSYNEDSATDRISSEVSEIALIIEDEVTLRSIIANILKKKGIGVIKVGSSDEINNILSTHHINYVIADTDTIQGDKRNIFKTAMQYCGSTKVILITNKDSIDHYQKQIKKSDSIIIKPFKMFELLMAMSIENDS